MKTDRFFSETNVFGKEKQHSVDVLQSNSSGEYCEIPEKIPTTESGNNMPKARDFSEERVQFITGVFLDVLCNVRKRVFKTLSDI